MANDKKLREKHLRVSPLASQTKSRAWPRVGTEKYPVYASCGVGTFLYDREGNRYFDLAGANAAVPLGYGYDDVVDAVRGAVQSPTLSLPTELEYETSRLMVDAVEGAEMVRWVRTGSEAVQAACIAAQAKTGRDSIWRVAGSYHGWHTIARDARHVRDLDRVVSELRDRLDEIAAVLWEPPRFEPVDLVRLQALRDACTETGTALISDEVVWGCRWATAGSREITHVQPDISCFSKALGNGYPVGCIVGSAEWIEPAAEEVSSTFGGELIGLAAAKAVLETHRSENITLRLRTIGLRLWELLDDQLDGTCIERYGSHAQHFRFQLRDGHEAPRFDKFLNACLAEGVLVHRAANNINIAMDAHVEDIASRIGHAAKKASK